MNSIIKIREKLNKRINDEKGAALIYTIIVTLMLIILGSGLLYGAVASIKLSQASNHIKKAFYVSDAGIEESLSELNEYSHQAEKDAVEWASDVSNYRDEEKWTVFLFKLQADTQTETITQTESLELMRLAVEMEFEKKYMENIMKPRSGKEVVDEDYILINEDGEYAIKNATVFSGSGINDEIISKMETSFFNPSEYPEYAGVQTPKIEVTSSYEENKGITITLISRGTYKDASKNIRVDLLMTPPKYSYGVEVESENGQMKENQILDFALVANENIIVSSSSSTNNLVEGSIYSYGHFPTERDYRTKDFGGIMLGYSTKDVNFLGNAIGNKYVNEISGPGKLEVTGDVITRSAVRFMKQNSNLSVGGSIYSNSIVFDKSSDDASLDVGANIYSYEDLIINGSGSKVVVGENLSSGDGEINLLLDGDPSGNYSTGDKSDVSGSIIVNNKSSDISIDANKIFIAGVAYIDIFRSVDDGTRRYFQTGESVTTNNNSYFYQSKLSEYERSTEYVKYRDNGETSAYYLVEPIDSEGNIIKSVKYKYDHYLTSILRNLEEGQDVISGRDRNLLTLRSVEVIGDKVYGFSENFGLGVVVGNKKVFNPNLSMDEASFEKNRKIAMYEIDSRTNMLRTRDYTVSNNLDGKINSFIEFPSESYIDLGSPENLIFINNDPNVNLHINITQAEAAALPSKDIELISDGDKYLNMQGIIATKGNVVVYNSGSKALKYTGSIVSDKNILLTGIGTKNFIHDYDIIYKKISSNDKLFKAYHGFTGRISYVVGKTSTISADLDIDIGNNDKERGVLGTGTPSVVGGQKESSEYSFEISNWKLVK